MPEPSSQPGSTARVDVVVRTRKIGHFFPAARWTLSTCGSSCKAQDADGRVIFWSGRVEDERQRAGGAGRAFL